MLEQIKKDGGDTDKWIAKAKTRIAASALMGFGHRRLQEHDPRPRSSKKAADDVLKKLGVTTPFLKLPRNWKKWLCATLISLSEKLYPNVDFYSGYHLSRAGIPVDMFTVMFAIGRLPGWIAQWKELRENKEPIGRPRQIYVGQKLRPTVEMKKDNSIKI